MRTLFMCLVLGCVTQAAAQLPSTPPRPWGTEDGRHFAGQLLDYQDGIVLFATETGLLQLHINQLNPAAVRVVQQAVRDARQGQRDEEAQRRIERAGRRRDQRQQNAARQAQLRAGANAELSPAWTDPYGYSQYRAALAYRLAHPYGPGWYHYHPHYGHYALYPHLEGDGDESPGQSP